MGTSTLKSTAITNRDATIKALTNAKLYGAPLQSAVGYATAAAADDTSSTYRLCALPSACIVRGVYLSSVAQGGSAAVDVGVRRATADGGAAISATATALFGSAVSLVSAISRSDVTNESTNYTAALREQPLWQAAGLSADPGGELDLTVVPTAALTNGGAIAVEVQFVM